MTRVVSLLSTAAAEEDGDREGGGRSLGSERGVLGGCTRECQAAVHRSAEAESVRRRCFNRSSVRLLGCQDHWTHGDPSVEWRVRVCVHLQRRRRSGCRPRPQALTTQAHALSFSLSLSLFRSATDVRREREGVPLSLPPSKVHYDKKEKTNREAVTAAALVDGRMKKAGCCRWFVVRFAGSSG